VLLYIAFLHLLLVLKSSGANGAGSESPSLGGAKFDKNKEEMLNVVKVCEPSIKYIVLQFLFNCFTIILQLFLRIFIKEVCLKF